MHKSRLEAFSDGVFAIIITIMVLEIKIPHEATFEALFKLGPIFISYALSFIYVGIYWNNHHHLLQAAKKVNGRILWMNLMLLFWLSLVPFVTGWMGENHFARLTIAAYGVVLTLAGFSYFLLTKALVAHHGDDSTLAKAIDRDWKGMVSVILYVLAIALSWWFPWVSFGIYVLIAGIWFIPDRRIEKHMHE